jgi:hypothetical protein
LKPGGRLIVIEVAHREHTRIGFIFGLFPDWWAGHDEGRVLEPFVSYDKWDELLRNTGFSGIDHRTLDPDSRVFPNGVFATHAVNDVIARLDSPLTSSSQDSNSPIIVIGGKSPKTATLSESLSSVLDARKWEVVPSIRDIIDFDCKPDSTFIILSELDHHTFAGFDDEQLDALQTIFNAAKHILWVTENAWVENPQQAMTIGFLRTLRMEYPDVQIQVLNVDKAENLNAEFLVETLLRLETGAEWQEQGLLWTQEPELYLSNGKVIVPRLKPDVEKNNRLNSGRRPILTDLDPTVGTVSLDYVENKPRFKFLEERYIPQADRQAISKVKVQYSLAKAIRIGRLGSFYLIQGKVPGAESTVVALSQSNASSVEVLSDDIITVTEESNLTVKSILPSIAAHLITQTILSEIVPGATVLIFEPPRFCVETLSQQAEAARIHLYFVSTTASPGIDKSHWIQLHDKETQWSIRHKLPRKTAVFYNLASDENSAKLSSWLIRCLPSGCSIRYINDLFQDISSSSTPRSLADASEILSQVLKIPRGPGSDSHVAFLQPKEILEQQGAPRIDAVIDWGVQEKVPCHIRSIETDQIFVDDKTYLLVGLAGDLGRSIARFMVERGARHIVLSSRSPKIDQRWIDDVSLSGGNILVLPM